MVCYRLRKWVHKTSIMVGMGFDSRSDFRKLRTCLPILLCLLIISLPYPAKSQSEGPLRAPAKTESRKASTTEEHRTSLKVNVNVVLVPVVVTDAANHTITDLGNRNFELYEDGQQQEIQYFSAEDAPISVGLLLDLSKSMTNKFDAEREAVSEFFKNANSHDDYFVIAFSTHPQLLADTTQSIGTIQEKLRAEIPNGSTALLDAISLAMTRMHSANYKRRALLIVSDGGDNNSHYKYREIIRLVRDSDVQVYAIGLFDTAFFKTFEEFMGKKWLSEITDATGGRTVTINNVAKMPEAAAAISNELRNQYVLGYRPTHAASDGKRRQIKVRVINSPPKVEQLQANYKRGYVIPKLE